MLGLVAPRDNRGTSLQSEDLFLFGRSSFLEPGSIPAASATNYPESSMISDHRNGATQSRLKTARTSRAALSLGFRRCCCAFSESSALKSLRFSLQHSIDQRAMVGGTFHGVSPKHLHRYLEEFVFRFNLR
ncbi:hypothetical protein DRQ32_12085, partial [bacterium]